MKIDCNVIKDLLPLYAEDMVSKESIKLVEEHICECESCKLELDQLRKDSTEDKKITNASKVDEAAPLKKVKKKINLKILVAVLIPVIIALGIIGEIIFKSNSYEIKLDVKESEMYTEAEREEAMDAIIRMFPEFEGCRLYSLSYAGDEKSQRETVYLADGRRCIDVDSSFRSPIFGGGGWNSNEIYTWHWIVAENKDGSWEVINYGYC